MTKRLLQRQVRRAHDFSCSRCTASQTSNAKSLPFHLLRTLLHLSFVACHITKPQQDARFLCAGNYCHVQQPNDEHIDVIYCQMTHSNAHGVRWWPLLAIALSLVHVNGQQLSTTQQQDFASITSGVGTIATSAHTASRQCLYGTQAFAVAIDGDKLPLISAARYGSGRVIQFGHEGMLTTSISSELFKLVRNSAIWVSGKASGVRIAGMTSWGSNIASSISSVRILLMFPCHAARERYAFQLLHVVHRVHGHDHEGADAFGVASACDTYSPAAVTACRPPLAP